MQSIKVKKIKETKSRITIKLLTVNRKMHVPIKEFNKRVKSGLYEVINLNPEEQREAS